MSEQELHSCKLIKVKKLHDNEPLNEVMERILLGKGININPNENLKEQFLDQLGYDENYFVFKDELYQAENNELDAYDAFCDMSIDEDLSISYTTGFYNGGTCFLEMINDELDKLSNK